MREIVIDTETTGLDLLDGHRVVEIGTVELINRSPTGKTFHHYLCPQRDILPDALAVHGLSAIICCGSRRVFSLRRLREQMRGALIDPKRSSLKRLGKDVEIVS
jgi:hypothetical protein